MSLKITLPICIPDTTLDFTQDVVLRPSNWSSSIIGYYYINQTTGDDTNNTYGSETAPRKTIPAAVPAGSYVEVAGGYDHGRTHGNYYTLELNGTDEGPASI